MEAAVRATAGATTGRGPGSKPKQACHMLSAIDQSARRPCWLALYSLSEHHYYHWVTGTHASIRPLGTANTHGRRRRGPRIHTNCDADAPPAASRSFLQPTTLGTFRLSLLPHLSFCFSPSLCWEYNCQASSSTIKNSPVEILLGQCFRIGCTCGKS